MVSKHTLPKEVVFQLGSWSWATNPSAYNCHIQLWGWKGALSRICQDLRLGTWKVSSL